MKQLKKWISENTGLAMLVSGLLGMLLVVLVALAGIGLYHLMDEGSGDDGESQVLITETQSETASETVTEIESETASETAAETESETAEETAAETERETAPESAAETESETAQETVTETESETAAEAAAETGKAPETGSETVMTSEAETETLPETEPETETETGTAPESETIAETEAVSEAKTESETSAPVYMTVTSACYLRSAPEYGDNILQTCQAGTVVEFLDDDEGWYHVRVGGSVEGYMGPKFLK